MNLKALVRKSLISTMYINVIVWLNLSPATAEQVCPAQQRKYLFDCDCTTIYLRERLGFDDADIMIRLWVYNADFYENELKLMGLRRRYGQERINEAVFRFFAIRWNMYRECPFAPAISD